MAVKPIITSRLGYRIASAHLRGLFLFVVIVIGVVVVVYFLH